MKNVPRRTRLRRLFAYALSSFLPLLFLSNPSQAAELECHQYKQVKSGSLVLYTLDYCMYNPYAGRVKWRLTNHTSSPIYNVSIANKIYYLTDGRIVKKVGESLASQIDPGASKSTTSDAVNTDENYGNWSDKNDNPVESISLEVPEIKFATVKGGATASWGTATGASPTTSSKETAGTGISTPPPTAPTGPSIKDDPEAALLWGTEAGKMCEIPGAWPGRRDCNGACRSIAEIEALSQNGVCDASLNCSRWASFEPFWKVPERNDCAKFPEGVKPGDACTTQGMIFDENGLNPVWGNMPGVYLCSPLVFDKGCAPLADPTGNHTSYRDGKCDTRFNCEAFDYDKGDCKASAPPPPASTTVPTPTNLRATVDAYADKIRVSWNSISGVTSYWLKRCVTGTTTGCMTRTVVENIRNDTDIEPGVTYTYTVSSWKSGVGYSNPSAKVEGRALDFRAPSGLSATSDTYRDKVVVSWNTVSSASSYYLRRCLGSNCEQVYADSNTSYTDSSITPGVSYSYSVQAKTAIGVLSAYSSAVTGKALALSAPRGLTASSSYSDRITVSWYSVSNADGYTLRRCHTVAVTAAASRQPSICTDVYKGSNTTYTDSSAEQGISYTYLVSAYDTYGSSTPSASATGKLAVTTSTNTTLSTPSVSVAVEGTRVTVAWPPVQNATGYNLYYAPYPAGQPVGKIDLGNDLGIDVNLPAGSAYYVYAQAYNGTKVSAKSSPKYFIAQKDTATSLPDIKANSWSLSWDETGNATLSLTLENAGNSAITKEWYGLFLLSLDNKPSNDDYVVFAFRSSSQIDPGKKVGFPSSNPATFSLYSDPFRNKTVPNGNYNVLLWLDYDNSINESSESNNVLIGNQLLTIKR